MTAPRALVLQTALRQADIDVQVPAYEQPGPISYGLDIDVMAKALDDGVRHAITTSIEAIGKAADGRVVLTARVRHEMLVHIENVPDAMRKDLVTGYFPGQNFPYAREALSQLTARSGYPAAIAPPIQYQRKQDSETNGHEATGDVAELPADEQAA